MASAQEKNLGRDSTQTRTKSQTLKVIAPYSLTELEARFIRLNELEKKTVGYRIQYYSGSREGANEAKAELIGTVDNVDIYVLYQQPNFKTKIGDFRTKLEAQKFQREMGEICKGCFIVREKIEFPPIKKSKP